MRKLISSIVALALLLTNATVAFAEKPLSFEVKLKEASEKVELPDGGTFQYYDAEGQTVEIDGMTLPRRVGVQCYGNKMSCTVVMPTSDTVEYSTRRIVVTVAIVAGALFLIFSGGGSVAPAAGGGAPGGPGGPGGPI